MTTSSGNFAAGLALACESVKAPCTTIVPNWLNKLKADYIKTKGAEIIYGGTTA